MEWFADVFKEATEAHGGIIAKDDRKHGIRFLASTFPGIEKNIRRKDAIKGGLALKLDEEEARLSAFTLRLICSNGLIHTHSEERQSFSTYEKAPFEEEVHRRYCQLTDTLASTAERFRNARYQPADESLWKYVINSLNQLQYRDNWRAALFQATLEEMRDRSRRRHFLRRSWASRRPENRFQLVNAITALAREERDPELRWEMERLGGKVLTGANELEPASSSPPVLKQGKMLIP